MQISIDSRNIRELRAGVNDLKKVKNRILRRALNVGQQRTNTRVIKEITTRVNLKRKDIKSKNIIKVKKATNTQLESSVTARLRGLQLANFPHRVVARSRRNPRGGGVNVTVRKGGRKNLRKAFIVALNTGDAIATREAGASSLRVLHGPSPSQIIKTIEPELRVQMRAVVINEIDRLTAFEVERAIERRLRSS